MTSTAMDNRCSKSRYHCYRAAKALNNMATTLLQRGHYSPALTTLSDSIRLMQFAFVSSATTTTTADPGHATVESAAVAAAETTNQQGTQRPSRKRIAIDQQRDPDGLFEKASRRYTRALFPSSSSSIAASTSRVSSALGMATATISENETDSSTACSTMGAVEVSPTEDADWSRLLDAAVRYVPNSTMLFPIRISAQNLDHFDNNNDDEQMMSDAGELTKDFGIILYKYGLTNFLLYQQQHHQRQQQPLQQHDPELNKKRNNSKKKHAADRLLHRALSQLRVAKIAFCSALKMDRYGTSEERIDPSFFSWNAHNNNHTDWLSYHQIAALRLSLQRQYGHAEKNQWTNSLLLFLVLSLQVQSLVFQAQGSLHQQTMIQNVASSICAHLLEDEEEEEEHVSEEEEASSSYSTTASSNETPAEATDSFTTSASHSSCCCCRSSSYPKNCSETSAPSPTTATNTSSTNQRRRRKRQYEEFYPTSAAGAA